LLKDLVRRADPPVTHGGVVAQVWRSGTGRHTLLARALRSVIVVPLDEQLGRRAGELLARAGSNDAIDAALVAMARPHDQISTTDLEDIAALVDVAPVPIDVISP